MIRYNVVLERAYIVPASACKGIGRLGFSLTMAIAVLCLAILKVDAKGAEFIPLGQSLSIVEGVSNSGIAVGRAPNATRWSASGGVTELGFVRSTDTESRATSISADGHVIVGWSDDGPDDAAQLPFLWTEESGFTPVPIVPRDGWASPGGGASDTSDDGSTVVGSYLGFPPSASGLQQAFRWTGTSGMVTLLPLDDFAESDAIEVSGGGTFTIGASFTSLPICCGSDVEATLWNSLGEPIGLGSGGFDNSVGWDVSDDGTIVYGALFDDNESRAVPARWASSVGWELIAGLQVSTRTSSTQRSPMSADGSLIGGMDRSLQNPRGFVWTEEGGSRFLDQFLIDELGLGSDVAGWTLSTNSGVTAVSRNGRFIAGVAYNPHGEVEAFLVDLGAPIPEPTTAALALLAVAGPLALRWRRSSGGAEA